MQIQNFASHRSLKFSLGNFVFAGTLPHQLQSVRSFAKNLALKGKKNCQPHPRTKNRILRAKRRRQLSTIIRVFFSETRTFCGFRHFFNVCDALVQFFARKTIRGIKFVSFSRAFIYVSLLLLNLEVHRDSIRNIIFVTYERFRRFFYPISGTKVTLF